MNKHLLALYRQYRAKGFGVVQKACNLGNSETA